MSVPSSISCEPTVAPIAAVGAQRSFAPPATWLRGACAAAVAVMGVFAFWPLRASEQPKPPYPKLLTATSPNISAPVDLQAFRAPLWVVPPPPPPPPAPPPPPPPLKLQLVAITSAGGGAASRAALVYDPDQDKLLTLHVGDSVSGRKIEKITSERVHVRDTGGERILSLRSDTRGGAP